MSYCFMNMRPAREGDGREPDFPDEMSYLLLADCRTSDCGLYQFTRDEANEDWCPKYPVTDELEALIESGKRFPPALAITRDKVSRVFLKQKPTLEEFSTTLVESLKTHLANQSDCGFILAPALQDEIGYISKSEWYWILQISKSDPNVVHWVSGDYFIYSNAITDFELTEKQVRILSGMSTA